VPFPSHILIDVTSFACGFGSYTVGEGEAALRQILVETTAGKK
jgi:hypothetical protein